LVIGFGYIWLVIFFDFLVAARSTPSYQIEIKHNLFIFSNKKKMSTTIDEISIFNHVYDQLENTESDDNFNMISKDDARYAKFYKLLKFNPNKHILDQQVECDCELIVDGESAGTFSNLNVEFLKSKATVAPFGLKDQTVVDPTVRKALEIPLSRVQFGAGWEDAKASILKKISEDFTPVSIELRPYKMHIYEPGGHFKWHRDTLHGDDHIATLVFVLPTKFKGGQLQFCGKWYFNDPPKSADKCCDDDSEPGENELVATKNTDEMKLPLWNIFYTDHYHRVTPVTEGIRIVLQFDVFYKRKNYKEEYNEEAESRVKRQKVKSGDEDSDDKDFMKSDDENSDNEDFIENIEGNHWWKDQPVCHLIDEHNTWYSHVDVTLIELIKANGRCIAIFLDHEYSCGALKKMILKDTDLEIYKALNPHFKISCIPIVISKSDDKCAIAQYRPYNEDDETEMVYDHIDVLTPFWGYCKRLLSIDGGYTGNEHTPSHMAYFSALMVINPK